MVKSYIMQGKEKRGIESVEASLYQVVLSDIPARTSMKCRSKPCSVWEKQILTRGRASLLPTVEIWW